jgi:CRISPR-associated exonuclease Cas4
MTVFRVTDLKQYLYCPRIVYYAYCLPRVRPVTHKMQAGIEAQESEENREQRRSLRAYGLARGERHFDIWLESPRLGLRGRLDMAIHVPEPEGEVVPVEYKNSTRKPGHHWIMQLTAYGEMLAERFQLPVRRGFFYFIPKRRAQEIRFTPKRRAKLEKTFKAMQDMVQREAMPPPPKSRRRCVTCEFRRFCNDVL